MSQLAYGKSPALRVVDARPTSQQPNLLLGKEWLNDHGNSRRLIIMFGRDLRYCEARRRWLAWDGKRWLWDQTGEAFRRAKETMREFVRQALDTDDPEAERFAIQSLNEPRLRHLLKLAQSEPEIAVELNQLDTHPVLLVCRTGTIDLSTSKLGPHQREHLITRLVDVDYFLNRRGPKWEALLRKVVPKSLRDYLQRAFGYSITGRTSERIVFVVFGKGRNGKTTLLTAFADVFKEHATTIMPATLMRLSNSIGPQSDLADLRGARFVQTSEWERGQQLSQAMLKRVAQGEGAKIKARRLYENPIIFPETHHLWIDTNVRPVIRDVNDPATFDRLHPIPFLVRIPKEEVDKNLGQALRTEPEQQAILAYAVKGARQWAAKGLKKPHLVEEATQQWREENETVRRFVEQWCERAPGFHSMGRELYHAYIEWARNSKYENIVSNRDFAAQLLELGCTKKHVSAGERYEGLRLKSMARRAEGSERPPAKPSEL
jgi:putative DNA primase/helicase